MVKVALHDLNYRFSCLGVAAGLLVRLFWMSHSPYGFQVFSVARRPRHWPSQGENLFDLRVRLNLLSVLASAHVHPLIFRRLLHLIKPILQILNLCL